MDDAAILFEKGSHSGAVVLAAFAREELGRARILMDLYAEIREKGRSITLEEIKARCGDHVKKQEWAQLSITQQADHESQLGQLMRERLLSRPGTKTYQDADEQLEIITQRVKRRTPQDRHDFRDEALYVDARNESSWNRPKEIDKHKAERFLAEAINDYILLLHGNPESRFNTAMENWKDRPKFPQPKIPEQI